MTTWPGYSLSGFVIEGFSFHTLGQRNESPNSFPEIDQSVSPLKTLYSLVSCDCDKEYEARRKINTIKDCISLIFNMLTLLS